MKTSRAATVLKDLLRVMCLVYIDDVIIHSVTEHQHLKNFDVILLAYMTKDYGSNLRSVFYSGVSFSFFRTYHFR